MSSSKNLPAPVYLAGPTGSGKSSVAIELANRLEGPAAIVNADAFQVYRGMEILSAAPSSSDLESVPHHLYGIFDPSENCDAAEFSRLAKSKIAELCESRVTPIVVAGSGLYLKAITHGLAPTPPGNPELRADLETKSDEELIAWYESLDPDGALKTNLKNRRYVTRNLEICLLSGKPASVLKKEFENPSPDFIGVFLNRDREKLYERINLRTVQMFEEGVVDEVSALTELSSTAAKAIGLNFIQELIAETVDKESCIAAIQQATRRYAKRQQSWFKRETEYQRLKIDAEESNSEIASRVFEACPELAAKS